MRRERSFFPLSFALFYLLLAFAYIGVLAGHFILIIIVIISSSHLPTVHVQGVLPLILSNPICKYAYTYITQYNRIHPIQGNHNSAT